MTTPLSEAQVDELTDLFGAFKLMRAHTVNPRGVTCLDDAKLRLLRHLQESQGSGRRSCEDAAALFRAALAQDVSRRAGLERLFVQALDHIGRLPAPRRRELQLNIDDLDAQLDRNLSNVRKADCAVLVAGEVSAGKSTLLNLLLGEEVLPTSLLSCTSVLCELRHSTRRYALAHPWDSSLPPERVSLEPRDPGDGEPGDGGRVVTPDELLSRYVHQKGDRSKQFPYRCVQVYWPFSLLQGGVFIVDSPGIGESREVTGVVKEYLSSAFSFIYVINSSNAGGLQPDRLQDLLSTLTQQRDDLGVFDPRSAIFICNKWDQVPAHEADLVWRDTLSKLRRCWPGLSDRQVFKLSATKAFKSVRESGFVTRDFNQLLEGIEGLLPLSLQCKLDNHCRWLSHVLRRSAFHLRVHIANETRSDTDRKQLTEQLHAQLDRLESASRQVAEELNQDLANRSSAACDQLVAHLASASTRSRLLQWGDAQCPDGDDWELLHELLIAKVNKRIRHEVHEWDLKNHIFTEIQLDLLHHFQSSFELMEDQLDVIEGGMVGRGGRPGDTLSYLRTLPRRTPPSGGLSPFALSFRQKVALGLAAPVLIPLGVVAGLFVLPVAGIRAIRAKLAERQLLTEYRMNKVETMSIMTDEILETFLDKTNLTRLMQQQLTVITKDVQRMIDSIPKLIEADRLTISQLQEQREATEVSLAEQYLPLYQRCQEIQGRLDLYFATDVRQYDVSIDDVTWDSTSPPIASGTFGDVHAARWRRADDDVIDVAIKYRRETLDEVNVSDVLLEEENLRKFRHPHIVLYHGTALRRSPGNAQVVMVMELCVTTLRSKLIGPDAPSPGRHGNTGVVHDEARRRVALYLSQLCDALVYLHQRALVHRDLKPQNILVSRQDVIKLADVGLTKPERDISGTRCGTAAYNAPEVLDGRGYGTAADIYSLGIITWELWYGRLAHEELDAAHKGDIEGAIRTGSRPSLTRIYAPPSEWQEIITQCWSPGEFNRPSASRAFEFFDGQQNILCTQ